jgi:hypothetical protein
MLRYLRAHPTALDPDTISFLSGALDVARLGKDFIRGDWGGLVMTDWPVVGSALLGLACWFGFLYLLLYLLSCQQACPP